jgi:cell wall-associated NlpC family hydrolase
MQTPVSGPSLANPRLPGGWTDTISADAWAHAADAYPHESLGIAWPGLGGLYERLANESPEPDRYAAVSDVDIKRITAAGAMVVHSHPDGPQCPSAADMRCQAAWGVPFVVLPIRANGPMGPAFGWGYGEELPYEGRPFRHGIWDCFRLIRDWFERERGIIIPDTPRDWEWWHHTPDLDLYRAGSAAQGFRDIPINDATHTGDVIFYTLRAKIPQHAAIVVDPHLILHHPAGMLEWDPGRRSTRDLRSRWQPFATAAVRHGP